MTLYLIAICTKDEKTKWRKFVSLMVLTICQDSKVSMAIHIIREEGIDMENAIIMASGLGTRMQPMTKTTPKPLLKVGDTPMVETVIEGLQRRKVDNIYIVVGYLGEQFNYLQYKYSNVKIIFNCDYERVNNISSIYWARKVLAEGDCFICEADLYVADYDIFSAELRESCYYGKMILGHSDDWVFEVGEDDYITRVGKVGDNTYNMVGIAYLKREQAIILAEAIEKVYSKSGYETLFWDDVVNDNLDKLKLRIHPVNGQAITEIDTVEELNKVNMEMFKSESRKFS